jgi:probable rRNA maturation factor
MKTLTLDILDETRRLPEEALSWLIGHSQRASRRLGVVGEIRIRIVDDTAMSAAHQEYMDIEGTTDILTFDRTDTQEHPRTSRLTLTDIQSGDPQSLTFVESDMLICLDEAVRQCTPHGYPSERELLLYVVHGLLHCLGFDDHEEAEYELMHSMEDAVLEGIGVGPVFHRAREVGE